MNVDKNQAYQEFKNSAGTDINSSIVRNIEDLRVKREAIKAKTEDVQRRKDALEVLNGKLQAKEDNKTQEEIAKNIIDE